MKYSSIGAATLPLTLSTIVFKFFIWFVLSNLFNVADCRTFITKSKTSAKFVHGQFLPERIEEILGYLCDFPGAICPKQKALAN